MLPREILFHGISHCIFSLVHHYKAPSYAQPFAISEASRCSCRSLYIVYLFKCKAKAKNASFQGHANNAGKVSARTEHYFDNS